MNENPWHWRTLLKCLGDFTPQVAMSQFGIPVIDPCPAELRMPLRSIARRAFVEGNPKAALATALLDVKGWKVGAAYRRGAPLRVQIVVPVRGAHDALRLCLDCLASHDRSNFETTIVCANEEYAPVCDIAAGPCPAGSEIVITPAPQSFAANVNLGASRSRSEFLVLLNSDAFVGPGWLDDLLAPFADPDVVAVGPMGTNVSGHQSIHPDYRDPQPLHAVADVGEITTKWRDGPYSPKDAEPYAARRLVGFCLAVRRSAWDEAGGMDERFENAYCDDDLSLRLNLVGKTVVVPDLLVLHEGNASFRELPDAEANYNRTLRENGRRFEEKWSYISRELDAWFAKRGVR